MDIFFISKMKLSLEDAEYDKAREALMMHVRKVVPWALLTAVATGIYMISQVFGPTLDTGLSNFQIVLLIKAFFGLWLGVRGFNQKFFKINPFIFKGHFFPFSAVLLIVILSQVMYVV